MRYSFSVEFHRSGEKFDVREYLSSVFDTLKIPQSSLRPAAVLLAVVASTSASNTGTPLFIEPDSSSPALLKAEARYFERGGRYIWGTNDCSRFVVDYLKNTGVMFIERPTTKELYDDSYMGSLKMKRVNVSLDEVSEYDVVVYRYTNDRGELAGHCGVIVRKDGTLKVEHNSLSGGGLQASPFEAYVSKMAENGVKEPELKVFRQESL